MHDIILEACAETLSQSVNAARKGADRLELCDRLDLDGITPPPDLIRAVKAAVSIPVRVMIRPRGGSFIYSAEEIEIMKRDIMMCHDIGVDGVVLGILTEDNMLDIQSMRPLIALAGPMNVVIHKAIDLTADPLSEMRRLQAVEGVTAILTSGGQETALAGAGLIRQMVAAREHLGIIAAGRINNDNLETIRQMTGASEFHGKKIVGNI